MVGSPVQEIKSRLDIVDVIRGYVKLRKAGANFKALCPFHNEKNPSFFVSPSKQIWHCFSCGKGGDIFSFVMEMEGGEFIDALRVLANKAGVKLKKEDPKVRSQRQEVYKICSTAANFFEEKLERSSEVQKYLVGRGLKKETIKNFRLGWAPSEWRGLSEFLLEQGYRLDDIAETGLIIKKEDGKYYDRFRSRIIFPIMDLHGEVIGFGGRIFEVQGSRFKVQGSELAKYINTPQTLVYDKSKVLYGLDKAKTAIRRHNQCVVVEGYTDVIASHQAGIENVVSCSGTALSEEQLRILKRYGENLILAFDQDLAGQEAAKRGINLAINFGFNTKIVLMPKDKDPADCIKDNLKGWKEMLESAQGIIDFYFKDAFSKNSAETVDGKKKIAKALLPVLKRIPDKIEQAHWLGVLSKRMEVEEKFLAEAMNLAKSESSYYQRENVNPKQRKAKSRVESLEERLLGFLLLRPEKIKTVDKTLFTTPTLKEILEKSSDSSLSTKARLLAFKAEEEEKQEGVEVEREIENCISQLKEERLRQRLKKISRQVKEAEQSKDKDNLERLGKKFNELSKKLASIK